MSNMKTFLASFVAVPAIMVVTKIMRMDAMDQYDTQLQVHHRGPYYWDTTYQTLLYL